jgi:hypothetical protein
MKHHDQILRVYADSGLRSAADWLSLGREIEPGTKPRAETTYRGAAKGEAMALFTRDQTKHKSRGR